ncbi:MAG: tetratricopeptide repeat protein [Pirellulales bacterium]|nr:tetratricopeptide repeat protein [Pirellulales bacterium]
MNSAASDATAGRTARRWWHPWAACGAIWLAIIAVRFEVIAAPPYFECVTGLWNEASYLADTQFDYLRLRYHETYVGAGGPRAYMVSALPTLIAWFMRSLPDAASVFVACHLLEFLAAAVTVFLVYRLLTPRTGALVAAACAAALWTTPQFSTQTDMLGMDLPTACWSVTACALICRGRPVLAAGACLGAFLMKPAGMLITVVAIAYQVLALFGNAAAEPKRSALRRLGALAALALALAVQTIAYRWSGIDEQLLALVASAHPLRALAGSVVICPDLVLLSIAVCLAALFVAARAARDIWRNPAAPRGAARLAWALNRLLTLQPELVFALLLMPAFVAALVRFGYPAPRYYTLLVPFLWVAAGVLLRQLVTARVAVALIVGMIVVNLANWNGRLFPRLEGPAAYARGNDRSHEYLQDLRSTQAACRAIERSANAPIVAGHPFPYLLSNPWFGYVSRPLAGYSLNASTLAGFPTAVTLFRDRPAELVFVSLSNVYYAGGMMRVPKPGPDDPVLYANDDPSPLIVFRQRPPGPASDNGAYDRWLIEQLWFDPGVPHGPNAMSLATRAQVLSDAGLVGPARELLKFALAQGQGDALSEVSLGILLLQQNELAEAAATAERALARDPDLAAAHYLAGLVAKQRNDVATALAHLQTCVQLDPRNAAAHRQLGILLHQRGNHAAAIEHLRRRRELEPPNALACLELGSALLAEQRWAEAATVLEAGRDLDENQPQIRLDLGVAYMHLERWDDAQRELEAALRLVPGWPAASGHLAAVRARLARPSPP